MMLLTKETANRDSLTRKIIFSSSSEKVHDAFLTAPMLFEWLTQNLQN